MRIFILVLLLELSLIAPVRAGETAARPVFHPHGEYVKVNGVALWYESEGNGEPIVLIAGGPGFLHSYFHPHFSRLANSFRVIYFDSFGRGKSERAKNAAEYTFDRDVEDVEDIRVALRLGKINVLGHSYGGMVAQGRLGYLCYLAHSLFDFVGRVWYARGEQLWSVLCNEKHIFEIKALSIN